MKLRSTIVRSSSLIALTWASATSTALAHTDSLGFIITSGSGAGLYNAEIFYGSWHSSVSSPEGALDLSIAGGSLVGTNPFALVPGYTGVSDGTVPPGLVAGVNYFFPDGNGGLIGASSGHDIYGFQSTLFLDLTPGSYTFGYNASSSFTATWQPSDPAINDGAFTIGSDGSLQVAGASGGAIDNSQTHFTSDNFNGGAPATFTGGTLQLVNGSTALSNNFTVDNSGGVIDSNYEDGVLSGDLDGAGVLTIAGPGSVEVTGANTHGGFLIDHGTLRAGSDSALGDPSADLTIEHGVFAPTGSMSIARNVVITGSDGGEFDVDTGLTLTINGQVSGSSCLYKQGSGTMVLNAPGANAIGACVEDGLLAFNNAFTGNVWVDPGGRMSGGGDIAGDVEVSGHIAPGNSPGVLTVAGDVTLLDGSTFDVDVDGATPGTGAGHHDQLILTNGGVFTANGALAPITRGISGSANNTYTPTIGDTYVIVDADGGVTGQFDSITQPITGLPGNARWDVFYTADEVILAVVADDFARLSTLALGNARRLAGALDPIRSLPSGNTAEARALFRGLASLGEIQLAAVLQQAAGDIHADAMAATQRAARATRQAAFDRLTQADPSRRVWGQALGGRSAIDGDHEAESFDTRSGGLMVGADAPLTHQIVLGGAFAYQETDANGDGAAQIQSYSLLGYGRWQSGANFFNGALSAGFDHYAIHRHVALSTGDEGARAAADGATIALDAEFGQHVSLYGRAFDAVLGLALDRVSRDALREDADAAVALDFTDEDNTALRARLGVRHAGMFTTHGVTLRPNLEAFWTHQFTGAVVALAPTLHGARFESRSPDADPDSLDLGAGLTAQLTQGAELFASYRGGFGQDQTDHAAQLGVRMAW